MSDKREKDINLKVLGGIHISGPGRKCTLTTKTIEVGAKIDATLFKEEAAKVHEFLEEKLLPGTFNELRSLFNRKEISKIY